MLLNTFQHLPGIGAKTERTLWKEGIYSWDDFKEPYPFYLSDQKINLMRQHLSAEADFLLHPPHPKTYSRLLNSSEHWRLFPHYRDRVAYLDIETTGNSGKNCEITTIALYDGKAVFTYVSGENLDDFPVDAEHYELLISYNGKAFDVPIVERYFNITLEHVHIDLCHVLRSLGYKGGLKGCEKQFGLDRAELAGVDGYFAVLLWEAYQRTGERRALETLLAYNVEDAVNLEPLMVHAYNLKLIGTPFCETHKISPPKPPFKPYSPDGGLIKELKRKFQYPWG